MKHLKSIVLLFMMVNLACAMEKENQLTAEGNWYVALDKKQSTQIGDHVNGGIGYYDQYDAQRYGGSMLFPIKRIDSLPIRYCGDKKFFITSATQEKKGSALAILDPAITQIAVVRGFCSKTRCKVDIYLGLESDKFNAFGNNNRDRIYPARIMTLQIPNWDVKYVPVKQEVEDFDIIAEVKQVLDKPKEAVLYAYQIKLVARLHGTLMNFFNYGKQSFDFDLNYWPDKENKLKTIAHK